MRSYDLDGVITAGIKPESPCIIITGRLSSLYGETLDQLKSLGIERTIPIYLRPYGDPADRILSGIWKATVINFAHIDEHWEDDPVQIQIIHSMCRVRIVIVKN